MSREFADLSLHCHQNLSNMFHAAGSMPWFVLLLSVHLYLHLESIIPEDKAYWFNVIGRFPRKLAYNLVFARVWLNDCEMLFEDGVEVKKETMFDVLVRPQKDYTDLLQWFAHSIRWPSFRLVDELPASVDSTLHRLNLGRASWIETLLRGLIVPGQITSFLLLGSLLDVCLPGSIGQEVSIELEKSYRDLQDGAANIGVLFNGASYWHASCIVGRVLGPHHNAYQVADWICGIEVPKQRQLPPIVRIVQNPTRHTLEKYHIDAFAYDSNPAGHSKSSYASDEFESPIITFDTDQFVEFISLDLAEYDDQIDTALYNASLCFVVHCEEINLSLRYNVSFIEAYHCGTTKHVLHEKFPYDCVKASMLTEYWCWGHADVDEPCNPGQEEFTCSATEVPPERVLVVEAYRLDEQILARAWCAHIGLSAIVGNISRGTCAACAIRQAFVSHVSVVILTVDELQIIGDLLEVQQVEDFHYTGSSAYIEPYPDFGQDTRETWKFVEPLDISNNIENPKRLDSYSLTPDLHDYQIDGAGDILGHSAASESKLPTGRPSSHTAGTGHVTNKSRVVDEKDFTFPSNTTGESAATTRNTSHHFVEETPLTRDKDESIGLFPRVDTEDDDFAVPTSNPVPPCVQGSSGPSHSSSVSTKDNLVLNAVSFTSNGEIIISAAVLGLSKDIVVKPENPYLSGHKDLTISFGASGLHDSKDKSHSVNRHLTLKFGDMTLELKGPDDTPSSSSGDSHLHQPSVEDCTEDAGLPIAPDTNAVEKDARKGRNGPSGTINRMAKSSSLHGSFKGDEASSASRVEDRKNSVSADEANVAGVKGRIPDNHILGPSTPPPSRIKSAKATEQSPSTSSSSPNSINRSQTRSLSEHISLSNAPIDSLTMHNLSSHSTGNPIHGSPDKQSPSSSRTWSLDYLHGMQLGEWIEEFKTHKIGSAHASNNFTLETDEIAIPPPVLETSKSQENPTNPTPTPAISTESNNPTKHRRRRRRSSKHSGDTEHRRDRGHDKDLVPKDSKQITAQLSTASNWLANLFSSRVESISQVMERQEKRVEQGIHERERRTEKEGHERRRRRHSSRKSGSGSEGRA